jgi:hypothetical protein
MGVRESVDPQFTGSRLIRDVALVIADIAILLILLLIYLNDEISIDLGTIGIQLFCGTIRWIEWRLHNATWWWSTDLDLSLFRERRVIRGL